MVEQAPTKEPSDAVAHGERQSGKKVASGNKVFKKKGLKGGNDNKRFEGVPDLLKSIVLS